MHILLSNDDGISSAGIVALQEALASLDEIWVVARKGYPRPIVNARSSEAKLDSTTLSGYVVEPVTMILPAGLTTDQMPAAMLPRLGLTQDPQEPLDGLTFLPSAGGIEECIYLKPVSIVKPTGGRLSFPNQHGFRSESSLQEFHAIQTLRAYQAGGMVDHRLEIGIYQLLAQLCISPGPWIGEEIALGENHQHNLPQLEGPGAQKMVFQLTSRAGSFLRLLRSHFAEVSASGTAIAQVILEYVVPANLSSDTVTTLPYMKCNNEIWIGLEIRDLPAPQILLGSSQIICVPAWRVPRQANHGSSGSEIASTFLQRDFDLDSENVYVLGGAYYPSPGTTPERVYPFAASVSTAGKGLFWIRLQTMIETIRSVRDGHLICSLFRLAHAMGLLKR